jgi:hypothetical protein
MLDVADKAGGSTAKSYNDRGPLSVALDFRQLLSGISAASSLTRGRARRRRAACGQQHPTSHDATYAGVSETISRQRATRCTDLLIGNHRRDGRPSELQPRSRRVRRRGVPRADVRGDPFGRCRAHRTHHRLPSAPPPTNSQRAHRFPITLRWRDPAHPTHSAHRRPPGCYSPIPRHLATGGRRPPGRRTRHRTRGAHRADRSAFGRPQTRGPDHPGHSGSALGRPAPTSL